MWPDMGSSVQKVIAHSCTLHSLVSIYTIPLVKVFINMALAS